MTGAGENGAGDPYLDRGTLARLVDNLTVEDVRLAQAEYAEGDPMRGFASVWHSARRELGADAGDLSAFLSRVRLRDLAPLLEAPASGNAPSDGAGSPPSAVSGA